MNTTIRSSFLLLIVWFAGQLLWAVNPVVRNFSKKESGSGTQNWDIVQYSNDWMYFANNNGLLEFDGIRWNIYPISNHTNVRSVYYDISSQRIYAGAFNEFGFYQRNTSGKLSYQSLTSKIPSQFKSFSEIWNIFMTGSTVYFQGDHILFRYENDTLSAIRFDNKITVAANVHNSVVLFQHKKGAFVLNGSLLIGISDQGYLHNKKVVSVIPYRENQILFITESDGLFLYNGIRIEPYQTPADLFLKENQTFCATINNNKLAIGTVRNGIVMIDLITGKLVFSNTFTGLQNNTVLSIAFDRQQNLWLGLDKGIDYVMVNEPVYDLFGNNTLYGAGYASAVYNNTLYLGTNQGLYAHPLPLVASDHKSNIKAINAVKGQIWHLSVYDNTLFCGSDNGCYLIEGNQATAIREVTGTWYIKPIPGHSNLLMGSSYNGFFILKKESNRWKYAHSISSYEESGSNFEFDNNGTLWVSHWMKGIFRLIPDDNFQTFISNHSYNTNHGLPAFDNNRLFRYNDSIFVNTINGIFQYDASTDRFIKTNLDKYPLFRHFPAYAKIAQSTKGVVWSFNNRSIKKIKTINGTQTIDSTSYNLLKTKFIPGFEHSAYLNDSILLVGTEDGFAYITNPPDSKIEPILHIAIRKVYLTGITDSLLYEHLAAQVNIPEIKPKFNSLKFEFSGTEYRNENQLQYSILLEPYDQLWSGYSSVNLKEYTNLSPGDYRFRVRARDLFNATTSETYFEFIILPRWYETTWAKSLYSLLLIGGVLILLRFVRGHSEKRVERMKQLKEHELREQREQFRIETKEKEKEIIELRNQKLQYELRHKSQDLANSTMNVIRKNEMLLDIIQKLEKISTEISIKSGEPTQLKQFKKMQEDIRKNIETDNNWKKFQENFDMVYEDFLKRLGEQHPGLSSSDKKLCAYLKMELSSKDIAPLMNMSYRSVEMSRYRLRKKFNLSRDISLTDFLRNS